MKLSTLLLAFILFLGVTSAFKTVTTFYTDEKCTQVSSSLPAQSEEVGKSGQCLAPTASDESDSEGIIVVSAKATVKSSSKIETWYVFLKIIFLFNFIPIFLTLISIYHSFRLRFKQSLMQTNY